MSQNRRNGFFCVFEYASSNNLDGKYHAVDHVRLDVKGGHGEGHKYRDEMNQPSIPEQGFGFLESPCEGVFSFCHFREYIVMFSFFSL